MNYTEEDVKNYQYAKRKGLSENDSLTHVRFMKKVRNKPTKRRVTRKTNTHPFGFTGGFSFPKFR
jgi:hypothetical protein